MPLLTYEACLLAGFFDSLLLFGYISLTDFATAHYCGGKLSLIFANVRATDNSITMITIHVLSCL